MGDACTHALGVARYVHPAPENQVRAAYAAGVVRTDRLEALNLGASFVRNQVRATRWTRWGDHVLLTHNAPPTRLQLFWLAVMDAGFPAALASHTALELAGFAPWAKEAAGIHLVVPRGARCAPLPGLKVHESRRIDPDTQVWLHGLPCTPVPQSAIDAGAWQPYPRFACAMLAAVVQQRLTTVNALDAEMRIVGRVRHKAFMRLALCDIADGAQALGELDVARMCRRFGLAPPHRQSHRRDAHGRPRYLDAEWELVGGRVGVLEVDGRHHLEVEHWEADMKRERAVVVSGRTVLRTTNLEVRLEPASIVADLVAIGVPRRGPSCQRGSLL